MRWGVMEERLLEGHHCTNTTNYGTGEARVKVLIWKSKTSTQASWIASLHNTHKKDVTVHMLLDHCLGITCHNNHESLWAVSDNLVGTPTKLSKH